MSLVETNTVSPVVPETLLNSYTCFSMKKVNPSCKYKYGGIHGICVIVSPACKDKIEITSDTVSECTLWLIFKSKKSNNCIIGAMYIPCEKARFYFDEVFEQIGNGILYEKNDPIFHSAFSGTLMPTLNQKMISLNTMTQWQN